MKERQAGRFSVFFVVLAVCLVYALGGGIRSSYGLMRSAIAGASGVDYAGISFVLAAAQLAFGVMQPVFGALALKTSNVFVLLGGAAMAVLGLVLTPLCRGTWALLLCFGILMPAGLGAFSFGLIMGPSRRCWGKSGPPPCPASSTPAAGWVAFCWHCCCGACWTASACGAPSLRCACRWYV